MDTIASRIHALNGTLRELDGYEKSHGIYYESERAKQLLRDIHELALSDISEFLPDKPESTLDEPETT